MSLSKIKLNSKLKKFETVLKKITKMVESYRKKLKEFPPKFSDFFLGKEFIITRYLPYDSDTIQGVLKIEDKEVTFPLRLLGYDSIEKKLK